MWVKVIPTHQICGKKQMRNYRSFFFQFCETLFQYNILGCAVRGKDENNFALSGHRNFNLTICKWQHFLS